MSAHPAGNPARRSPVLESLFPPGVTVAELRSMADVALLHPEEREHVARSADRRVRDFAGGRLCARLALETLGIHDFPLRAGEDRCAQWPEGITGSITHTKAFCAAVAAPRERLQSVGIDAEVIARVTAPMRSMICTEAERSWIETLAAEEQAVASALAFSCKEAFYKCQYPLSRQWLDFKDVCIVPEQTDIAGGRYALRVIKHVKALEPVGTLLEGRFAVDGPLIISTMAFPG